MNNKRFPYILCYIAFFLFGCAEPNDPYYPSENSALELISQTRTLGWSEDVWVSGNTAYVADGEWGISYWDVSDPGSPTLLDTLRTSAYVEMVAVSESNNLMLMYEKTEAGGLSFYQLDTKQRYGNMGSGTITDFKFKVIAPDTIFVGVADWTDGILVSRAYYDSTFGYWEMSEFAGDMPISPGVARGLDLFEEVVLVAHSQIGLDLLGMEYDTNLGQFAISLLSNINTTGAAYDVEFTEDGRHAVVAGYQGGLQVFEVGIGNGLVFKGSVSPKDVDRALRVTCVGDTAYFIDQFTAVYAVDISDVTEPLVIGIFETSEPTGLFVTEDHTIYVADEDDGLLVLGWRDRN